MKAFSKIMIFVLLICPVIIVIGLFLHYFASGILHVDTFEQFAEKVNYNYYLGDAFIKIGIIAFLSVTIFLFVFKSINKTIRKSK